MSNQMTESRLLHSSSARRAASQASVIFPGDIDASRTPLYDVLERIDFTRKFGQSEIPDIKLRQLITHFTPTGCVTRTPSSSPAPYVSGNPALQATSA